MRKRVADILFFFISLLLFSLPVKVNAQNNNLLNQLSIDSHGNTMLIGKCTRESLQESPFSDWFDAEYKNYRIDSVSCNLIKPLLFDKSITIFMGTWCDDSKVVVPRFFKILDNCNFLSTNLTLIMVSNKDGEYKKSPQHDEAGRNIVRVPTIIIEEKSKEVGRIIESPVKSLEKDLLAILNKAGYIPNFNNEKVNTQ